MDMPTLYFPDFSNETRLFLWELNGFINSIFETFPHMESFVAFLGLVTNTIHLMVLTRKVMMTSSTNVILIGIGIYDLTIMLMLLVPLIGRTKPGGCDLPPTLLRVELEFIGHTITDFSRRCSLWLGLSLAAVRYIVLKHTRKLRPCKLKKLRIGWFIFAIISITSSLFSLLYWGRLTVISFADWVPEPVCGFPEKFSLPLYGYYQRSIYYENNELLLKFNFLLNGIFSKILPCILFILLTIFLIRELNHVDQTRKNSGREVQRKTTKLVIYMTISYLVAELPLGIVNVLEFILTDNPGFLTLIESIKLLFNFINTLNATVHCFICFSLSIHYRSTVRKMFCGRRKQVKTIDARMFTT
ncbi:hypothetical protein CAEBREN_01377 [Caenorhabditis brenneri]|uniref:G-protein coupled receptors family 1 profile domain-containing protein n=1 Tax=Caenorhabditis brenneri TaxID=135651 RepID=G0NEX3_CAEBE|nr:hypothetical protein CAEBREN_01377 [Caenorhabditis brenneri]